MVSKTKSKNLNLYPYFFGYERSEDIPFNILAGELEVHVNRLIGMVRSAKHNQSIYEALLTRGYSDSEIPTWFVRPQRRRKKTSSTALVQSTHSVRNNPRARAIVHSEAPAQPLRSGQTVSNAEQGGVSAVNTLPFIPYGQLVSGITAERFSVLSTRSADQSTGDQWNYWSPSELDPLFEAQNQRIHESFIKNVKERLKKRKPLTPEQLLAKLSAEYELREMQQEKEASEILNMFMVYHLMNSQPWKTSSFDVKEFINGIEMPKISDHDSANRKPDPTIQAIEACTLIANQLLETSSTKIDIEKIKKIGDKRDAHERAERKALLEIFKEKNDEKKRRKEEMMKPYQRSYLLGADLSWDAVKRKRGIS